ncbi:RusA family crossover junction endodeoxyribonuclease [Anaerotruncus colihominis]|uniref:RusA family crossover junction endodeoxyribonuclease n=1 Tax=Anaerotruncus colihominis TaxID=169435 RepID=UPI00242B1F6A|nr:RusA family crossover junction endodeoxyribonuclease [Anaerotruncus colihominis]
MTVKFTVLGEPAGKGRPRFSNAGPYVKAYTPEKTVSYENLVKLEYRRQCKDFRFPDGAPLDLRITAYYSIPKSASKKKRALMEQYKIRPMKKPDNDNIVKIIQDALNLIAYHDDVQIVDCQLRKFYSSNPRVVVTIREAAEIVCS